MKSNRKTAIIAISMIVVFSLALSICMFFVSCEEEQDKSVSEELSFDSLDILSGDAPETQQKLQAKFSKYSHVSEKRGRETLTIFSKEQFDETMKKVENGERFYLTQEEAIFLINDSVRIYDEYSCIGLYGWPKLDFVREDNAYETEQGKADPLYPVEVRYIDCYHSNYSEYTYREALDKYQAVMKEIYDIISYRFAMHDSRFFAAYTYHVSEFEKGVGGKLGNVFGFDKTKFTEDTDRLRVLMTDNGELKDENEYKNYITELYDYVYEYKDTGERGCEIDHNNVESKYPIFMFCTGKMTPNDQEQTMDSRYKGLFAGGIHMNTGRYSSVQLFPPKSLREKAPEPKLDASCFENYDEYTFSISMSGGNFNHLTIDGEEFKAALGDLDVLTGTAVKLDDNGYNYKTVEYGGFYITFVGEGVMLSTRGDGQATISISNDNHSCSYKLDTSLLDGYNDYISGLKKLYFANIFNSKDLGLPTERFAPAGMEEYHNKVTEILWPREYAAVLQGSVAYAEFADKYGIAFKDPKNDGRYMYYTHEEKALCFELDNAGMMINAKVEDTVLCTYFHVTEIETLSDGSIMLYTKTSESMRYGINVEKLDITIGVGAYGWVAYSTADMKIGLSCCEVDALELKFVNNGIDRDWYNY